MQKDVSADYNGVYEEQVHTNCTVIVYENVLTGEKQVCWWDNEHPEQTYQQEEE